MFLMCCYTIWYKILYYKPVYLVNIKSCKIRWLHMDYKHLGLETLLHHYTLGILLLSSSFGFLHIAEAHLTKSHCFNTKAFYTYSNFHSDGTAHTDIAVIIKTTVKHNLPVEYNKESLQTF